MTIIYLQLKPQRVEVTENNECVNEAALAGPNIFSVLFSSRLTSLMEYFINFLVRNVIFFMLLKKKPAFLLCNPSGTDSLFYITLPGFIFDSLHLLYLTDLFDETMSVSRERVLVRQAGVRRSYSLEAGTFQPDKCEWRAITKPFF